MVTTATSLSICLSICLFIYHLWKKGKLNSAYGGTFPKIYNAAKSKQADQRGNICLPSAIYARKSWHCRLKSIRIKTWKEPTSPSSSVENYDTMCQWNRLRILRLDGEKHMAATFLLQESWNWCKQSLQSRDVVTRARQWHNTPYLDSGSGSVML